ncbi:hypothetical protein [Cryobacterium tagatosivorans]|nr:hypothetical protein [Cryobacterium tagatosivorans]
MSVEHPQLLDSGIQGGDLAVDLRAQRLKRVVGEVPEAGSDR